MLLFTLLACKAPPDAPKELEDLMGYLYAHVEDEDPDALEAGLVNMDTWLAANLEDAQDGYTLNSLSAETIAALGAGDHSLDGLAGAAVAADSEEGVSAFGKAVVRDNPMEIYEGTYDAYERSFDDNKSCYLKQDCDRVDANIHSTSQYPLNVTVTSSSHSQYRWVELPDDAGTAMIMRSWLTSPAEMSVDFLSVEVNYFMWVFLPTKSGTRSVLGNWVIYQMNDSPIAPDFALNLVVDSMTGMEDSLDAWVEDK